MAAPASVLLLDGGMGHLLKQRGVEALPGLPELKYDELFLVRSARVGGGAFVFALMRGRRVGAMPPSALR